MVFPNKTIYTPFIASTQMDALLEEYGWEVNVSQLHRTEQYWVIGRRNVPKNPILRWWQNFHLNEDKFWIHIDGKEGTQQLSHRPDIGDETLEIIDAYMLPRDDARRSPDLVLTLNRTRHYRVIKVHGVKRS